MIFQDHDFIFLNLNKEKDPVEEEKLKTVYLELKELSKKYSINLITAKAPIQNV